MTVLYENAQWQITKSKIRTVPGVMTYEIDADRLLEVSKRGAKTYYDWPIHMAEKTWVDVEALHDAFVRALELHKGSYSGEVDHEMLADSLAYGRKEGNRR